METEKILTKKLSENEKEAETGYVKLNWKADEIKKEMATISIENKSKVPGFGGIYWQYFEDLDKIKTNSGASLSVSKELYLKKNTDKGEKLERITSNNPLTNWRFSDRSISHFCQRRYGICSLKRYASFLF